MTLLISNENVQQALDSGQLQMQAIMDAIEGAYGDLASDKAAYAPRRGVSLPVNESHGHPGFQDERFVFGTMEGGVESSGYFAIRLKLDISYRFEDPATGAKTHEKYCMEPGRYCGLILLVDTNTAEPLAILNDGVVQHLRVAATNAIAAKYMARTDASVLGLYGSGGMARSHAHLMTRVRDLHEIKVYSPTRAHRELFASEIEEELGIPVRAVNAPEALPHECDILAACTDSNVPVISSSALHPGVMLTVGDRQRGGRSGGRWHRRGNPAPDDRQQHHRHLPHEPRKNRPGRPDRSAAASTEWGLLPGSQGERHLGPAGQRPDRGASRRPRGQLLL